MRELFLLRPDVVYLNHGSFGACPRPVFERYQHWQRELEAEPVEFLVRRGPTLLASARGELAGLLRTPPGTLLFVVNATFGVNLVARSIGLQPGDVILGTNHEYGACDHAWEFLCGRAGATYRRVDLPVPIEGEEEVVERIMAEVDERTRMIFVSHITAPTAITLPVAEICRRAREFGIPTLVDGAHAPGQLDLDLEAIGADYYVGNLHKWLCAPKGAAFLHASPEAQERLEPLVVSWGWLPGVDRSQGFVELMEYSGTSDISAPLSVPAAIAFQREHAWERVRDRCHEMMVEARPLLAEALGGELLTTNDGMFAQMSAVLLPAGRDAFAIHRRLYEEFRIEIPAFQWHDRQTIRLSLQGYNDWSDVEALLGALRSMESL